MDLKALFRFWRAPARALVAVGLVALGPRPALAVPDSGGMDQGSTALGSLMGTVAVTDAGQPVPGALVRILGTSLQATTGSSGHFTINDVPTGTLQVSVIAPGYVEITRGDIRVTAGNTTSIQIQLQPTPNFMEKVTVAASKEPLSIGEVPGQVNVIDNIQILRKGDLTLTQAIANVPGLMVANVDTNNIADITLRGVPSTGFPFATTLLLIDGVPQADSRNSADALNLLIEDASSIEVVRGPNAAIYGRTAVAGSVNVLTADPTLDHRVTFDGLIGSFKYLRGAARASGPIESWGGYYVSWTTSKDAGYTKQSYDLTTKNNGLFAKFAFTPDGKSHGKITINNVISDMGKATFSDPIIGGQFLSHLDPRFDRLTNLQIATSNFHQEDLRTTLNYRRQLTNWLEFVEVFGYHTLQYKWTDDAAIIGAPFDLSSQLLTQYPYNEALNERTFYQDGHFVIKPHFGGVENSLLLGVSYDRTTGFDAGNFIYTDPVTLGWPINYLTGVFPDRSTWKFLPYGGGDYKMGITGVFGQYIISPAQMLNFNVGGRYDRLDLSNVQTFTPGQPKINEAFDSFSPKVSATVKLLGTEAGGGKGALNIYGVYSKAFLPPRRPSELQPAETIVKLQPVKVTNYEVGLKSSLLGARLSLEATFFKMKENGVIVQTREGPFFVDSNGGVENFRGVEVGVTWAPIRELSFYANGAFYHNRFGEFVIQSSSGNTVLTGNRLSIAPDRVYSAGATFEHRSGWESTLNLKHIGAVFLDQKNTFMLDPYTLVDASLSWKHEAVRLTLGAHNLFNEKYYSWGDTSTAQSANVGTPRQVVLKTSVTFK